MSFWAKFFISLLVVDLVFINSAFIFLYLKPLPASVIITPVPINTPTLFPSPTSTFFPPSPTTSKPIISKTKTVAYIPLPGSGSLLSPKWADLSGTDFYFDTTDFPGLKDAYFEANMKLLNGNGFAFLRLFDVTAGIEIWGSEVKTNNQAVTAVVSGKLTLRPGKHLIRVQAKSLTADTTIYISGRLKIITEN